MDMTHSIINMTIKNIFGWKRKEFNMIKDKIYTEKEIQEVWQQHSKNCNSILWSDDNGLT
jgi:hypothetical protein